jgi:S-adenosyl-L-methionine hydrolase (adenosine-forming)
VARPILFLSDYGLDDEFVGMCHSVVARIAPDVRVIDLTHGIPPGDVARGALVLADAVPFAPDGVVFLAVVDPGVGTARAPVAVEAGDAFLVGPDNGVLSSAWNALGGTTRAFVIESDRITLSPVSATFHGRDVFAPAAAHLADGGSPDRLGGPLDPERLARIQLPAATVSPGSVRCRVIGIDRFGNVQLSARREDIRRAELDPAAVLQARVGGEIASLPRVRTFAEVPQGRAALIVDSTGRLALTVNRGSAAERLKLQMGEPVELFGPPT